MMIKTVDASWLAEKASGCPHQLLLLDTREADDYCRGCISGSVHMACSGVNLKRLKTLKLKIECLLGDQQAKAKYAQARESEEMSVVVCDSSSSSLESLASDSLAALLLKKLSRDCKSVAFLAGGYQQFFVHYSDLCDKAESDLQTRRPSSLVLQLNSLSLSRNSNSNNSVASPMEVASSSESEEEDSPEIIPPFEILPHLYLGCRKVATCLPGLRQNNVTRILNVTSSIPNHFEELGFTYKQIAVEDKHEVDMREHFSSAFQFIENARLSGEKVLVHCYAGMSRSVTIILAYLMKYYNHTLESAHQYVKERKTDINPNFSFMGQLLDFECSLRPSPADSGFGSSPVEGHYFLHSPATEILLAA